MFDFYFVTISFNNTHLNNVLQELSQNPAHSQLIFRPQNSRCLCKCPDVSTVTEDAAAWKSNVGDPTRRSVYINSTVTPDDCDCPHVVLPYIRQPPLTETQADAFCPRYSSCFGFKVANKLLSSFIFNFCFLTTVCLCGRKTSQYMVFYDLD